MPGFRFTQAPVGASPLAQALSNTAGSKSAGSTGAPMFGLAAQITKAANARRAKERQAEQSRNVAAGREMLG